MMRFIQVGNYELCVEDSTPTGRQAVEVGHHYEWHVVEELQRLLAGKKTFLDVGANVGIHVLNVKNIDPSIQIVALDVNPPNIACLLRTVARNKFTDVTILPVAVSDKAGVVIYDSGELADSNVSCWPIQMATFTSAYAQALPLDFFNIPPPDVVKLDVEGFELLALRGAARTLRHCPPVVFEYFPQALRQNGSNPIDLLDYFIERGYSLTVLDHKPGIKKTFKKSVECANYIEQVDPDITDILAEK
jgi:FkbM family methyltransferase